MTYRPEPSPNLTRNDPASNRVKDEPRGNFQFAWHPDEWQINARGELVPTIVHISKEAGDGGVDASGDFTVAKARYEGRGFRFIPHNFLAEDVDYVALYRNKRNRKVHRSVFQTPADTAEGTTEWSFDEDGWSMFITLLRKRGVITQPRPKVLEGMLVQRERALAERLRREPDRDAGEKHEAWHRKVRFETDAIEMLKRELEKSYEVHGRPAASVRNRLRELLEEDAADSELTPEERALRAKAREAQAKTPPPQADPPADPDLDGDIEADEDPESVEPTAPTPPATDTAAPATSEAPPASPPRGRARGRGRRPAGGES